MADANIVYQQEETCGILWVNLVNSPCTFRCESPLLPNVGFHRTVRLGMNEHNVHILKLAIRKPLEIYIGWAARPQPPPPEATREPATNAFVTLPERLPGNHR